MNIVAAKSVETADGKSLDGVAYHGPSYVRLARNINKFESDVEVVFGKKLKNVEALGSGHFYTSFTLLNFLKDDLFLESGYCAEDQTHSLFLGVKLQVTYRGARGTPTSDFIKDHVLLVAGRDTAGTNPKDDGNRGCYLKSVNIRTTGPYLLYQGVEPGHEQYELHFTNNNGLLSKPSKGEVFFKLATAVLGVLPMITLPAGSKELANEATKQYDAHMKSTRLYELTTQAAANITMGSNVEVENAAVPSGASLKITLPWLQQMTKTAYLGSLDAFMSRSISNVVDSASQHISPTDVMSHPTLGWPHSRSLKNPPDEG